MQNTTLFQKIKKWSATKKAALSAFLMAVPLLASMELSSNSDTRAKAHIAVQHSLTAARFDTSAAGEIPVVVVRNTPLFDIGISKNPEVVLSDSQVKVVKAFDAFLRSRGENAVVTSGKRTSEGQLNIIKERVAQRGATSRFPKLEAASIIDTKIWLKAWQWLRHKHVPVNAPAAVPGTEVRTSMHLKGLAIDFISSDLDHLRGLLADFSHSKYANEAPLHITGIVREPGCVHINLG